MKVRNLAASPLAACSPKDSLAFAAWELWVRGCGVLAVVEGKKVVGFLTAAELPSEVAPGGAGLTAGDVMRDTFPYCRCDEDVETALERISREGLKRIPVLDDRGGPWGLLSVNDVLLRRRPPRGGRRPSTTKVSTLAG